MPLFVSFNAQPEHPQQDLFPLDGCAILYILQPKYNMTIMPIIPIATSCHIITNFNSTN